MSNDEFLEWLNEEITQRSEEIENMGPRSENPRKSDKKVGINRGLRIARDEYIERVVSEE